jgi:hypothetical protein
MLMSQALSFMEESCQFAKKGYFPNQRGKKGYLGVSSCSLLSHNLISLFLEIKFYEEQG